VEKVSHPSGISHDTQHALLDLVIRQKLMLDSVDTWILSQPSIINKRAKSVIPIVRERTAIAESLVRHMQALGLELKGAQVPNLADYLKSKERAK